MVWSGDDNAIYVFLSFEHLAEVRIAFRFFVSLLQLDAILAGLTVAADGPSGHGAIYKAEVHVCESHDVLTASNEFRRVSRALSATADDCNIDGITRRLIARPAQHFPRHDH